MTTNAQFKTILSPSSKINSIETIESKVGPVPRGSLLSYQQKKIDDSTETIINNPAFPTYPGYTLPTLDQNFNTVLNLGEQNFYEGLTVSKTDSEDIEQNTIEQSKSPYWNSARKHRITSSKFKRVCSRKKDFETLVDALFNNSYKLKSSHEYYYQIMGQMGLAGALWCDLFIWCRDDYHLERINFVPGKWQEMKQKPDMFYFHYYLPTCVQY
ncbi:uncharacterized protein LOC133199984 [Saccostrea echinata]|uniref:uncharacterized protein LOC133199984 n=1 Tax=Saccostrea echinata TaxID=191078 RepID=UPI002A7F6DCA|nr:uncharacterized protein LOC133199984 [Saccostrea echinata]